MQLLNEWRIVHAQAQRRIKNNRESTEDMTIDKVNNVLMALLANVGVDSSGNFFIAKTPPSKNETIENLLDRSIFG